MRAGARKQALVPVGAAVLEPVGTAPGLLVGVVGRWSRCCPGRRASCRRCGRRRSTTVAAARAARVARGRWSSGSCASSRCPSRRSRRRCASSTPTRCRSRSRPACAAASSRWRRCSRPPRRRRTTSFEAALRERHGDVLFSDDGATIDEVVARLLAGPDDRDRRVVHRRADGGPADRPRGLLGLRAGRARRVLQRGQDGAGGRAGRADRGARRGLARGRDRAVGGRARRAWAPTSGSASPASPARAAGSPEKPVGTVCLSVRSAADAEERTVRLPGGRADVRDRTTTVALHMLRALLLRA